VARHLRLAEIIRFIVRSNIVACGYLHSSLACNVFERPLRIYLSVR
jgi:hypothetical protein